MLLLLLLLLFRHCIVYTLPSGRRENEATSTRDGSRRKSIESTETATTATESQDNNSTSSTTRLSLASAGVDDGDGDQPLRSEQKLEPKKKDTTSDSSRSGRSSTPRRTAKMTPKAVWKDLKKPKCISPTPTAKTTNNQAPISPCFERLYKNEKRSGSQLRKQEKETVPVLPTSQEQTPTNVITSTSSTPKESKSLPQKDLVQNVVTPDNNDSQFETDCQNIAGNSSIQDKDRYLPLIPIMVSPTNSTTSTSNSPRCSKYQHHQHHHNKITVNLQPARPDATLFPETQLQATVATVA